MCRLKVIQVLGYQGFRDCSTASPKKPLENSSHSSVLQYGMMALLVTQEFAWARSAFALVTLIGLSTKI